MTDQANRRELLRKELTEAYLYSTREPCTFTEWLKSHKGIYAKAATEYLTILVTEDICSD